jgi:hypothetical protein
MLQTPRRGVLVDAPAVDTHVLFVVYALTTSALVALLFKWLWGWHTERATRAKWGERERLLDRRRGHISKHEIRRRRSRPAAPRDRELEPRPGVAVAAPQSFARVLYILARDQHELATFLHQDLAAEEAEGLIEILMDRRSPQWQGGQSHDANGRRDPERNRAIAANLRETGCAFVRQPAPQPEPLLQVRRLIPATT